MREKTMKKISENYNYTIYACYAGYVVQAVINNLAPLLFLTFQREFGISLERIGLLITINFGVQILTDMAAAKYADRIGYRASVILAHVCSAAGLICMGTLPFVLENAYMGLVASMALGAVGGGLIEVLKQRPDLTALLDVTWPEPPQEGSELYTLPNVRLSSHIAGSLNDEVHRMADYVIGDYIRFAGGEPLVHEVTEQILMTH